MISDLVAANVRREAPCPPLFWIGCSDCVEPAAEILGLPAGAVFEHRNLANRAPPLDARFLASLSFAVESLGVIEIVVCGHRGRRRVAAALDPATDGLTAHWLQPLRVTCDALDDRQGDPKVRARRWCEHNMAAQVAGLAADPIVRRARLPQPHFE